jgi:hypothetical protein
MIWSFQFQAIVFVPENFHRLIELLNLQEARAGRGGDRGLISRAFAQPELPLENELLEDGIDEEAKLLNKIRDSFQLDNDQVN